MADEQDPIEGDDAIGDEALDDATPGETTPGGEPEALDGDELDAVADDAQPDEPMAVDDGIAPEAADEDAAPGADGEEAFEVLGEVPEMEPAAAMDAQAVLGVLGDIVGSDASVLYAFGQSLGETLSVGLGSVVGQRPDVTGITARLGEFSELEQEFGARPHVSADLRVAIDEAEVYAIAIATALDDLGELFAIDTSPEQMADEEFASGQLEVVASGLKEFLDLAGLMLFSDGLAGTEVTLGDLRFRGVAETVAEVAAAAGEPFALHIALTLALPEGGTLPVALAAPAGLVARLAALSAAGDGEDAAADATAAGAPAREPDLRAFEHDEPPIEGHGFPPPPPPGGLGLSDLEVHPVRFPTLGPADGMVGLPSGMDLIMDVSLRVTVELGRSSLTVEEVLTLGPGSVIELNKLAGEPVDILVNGRPIAQGEIVVANERYAVRVVSIREPSERIESLA